MSVLLDANKAKVMSNLNRKKFTMFGALQARTGYSTAELETTLRTLIKEGKVLRTEHPLSAGKGAFTKTS